MAEAANRRSRGREERRRQILETALAVFTEKGFHAANVADVAVRAGISQGTIYLYFDSKEALLEAAVRSFFEDFGQQVDDLVQQAPTVSEKLRSLGLSMAELARAAAGIFSLFLGYWASSKDRDRAGQLWADLLLQGRDPVIAIIEEGIREGEFRRVDAPSLVWAIMAAYDGLAAYVLLLPGIDLEQISRSFMDTLLSGLRPGTAETQPGDAVPGSSI
jgi:AcrR family transcriptional regulator